MRYTERLNSTSMSAGLLPWEFKPKNPIPDEVRTDKKKRVEWITNPATTHYVYSFYEGVNPNLRVTKRGPKGDGNPPFKMGGLVADYDSVQPEDLVLKLARSLRIKPNWLEKTLSKHWRFIWLFEAPAALPSGEFTEHFLASFHLFGFDVKSGMIGFDEGAWMDPSRLYTNSCDWRPLESEPISKALVQGWLVKASETFKWTSDGLGVAVPLEIVRPELEKKFDRFSSWPGEFVIGSQGPTFWVEDSTSPKSAVVRETGMQTFAAHAHKAFFSWSDLLGHQFVKNFEAVAIGRAVEGIFFDGKHYFRQIADKAWRPFEKSDIALHLKVDRKVSPKPHKNCVSDLERCIAYVQSNQSVIGCAPFIMRPAGMLTVDGTRILNTSTRTVLAPANEPAVWGANGQFPWLSNLHDRFFDPAEQLDFFLSWLSRFYVAAYNRKPRSGQNIFIAGDPNVGKTLLATGIIGRLVGGFADAKEYLLGQENFGSELFEVGMWCVDDSTFTADYKTRKHFSEMIKRMAANRTFRYHAKFRIPLMVEWQGRVVVLCNRDEESISVLPDLEISILDKIMLFKTADKTVEFLEPEEQEAILKRELPFFARFLLDYRIPEHCRGDARFGVKSYHEDSLVQTATQSSNTASFSEILDDWKTTHFTMREPEKPHWEGTSFMLLKAFHLDPLAGPVLRSLTASVVGKRLAALKNKGEPIESRSEKGLRIWRIYRPGAEPQQQQQQQPAVPTPTKPCKKSRFSRPSSPPDSGAMSPNGIDRKLWS